MIERWPKPGDIGLTSIRGPVGWGIRLGQWLNGDGFSQYEHAFIVVDGGEIVEAMPGGAKVAPLDKYDPRPPLGMVVPQTPHGGKTVYVAPAGLTDGQRVLIADRARQLVGTPYSFADYAALAAHRFHLPVPWLRRYVASSRHMICSQMVDRAYQDAGIQLFNDGRWNGLVTPADLWELLGREEARRV